MWVSALTFLYTDISTLLAKDRNMLVNGGSTSKSECVRQEHQLCKNVIAMVNQSANVLGSTRTDDTDDDDGNDDEDDDDDDDGEIRLTYNYHLCATFREIAVSTRYARLHFRDWSTVSHAWCTPSAKLTALTVLMVGETYKRGLLPRLPMDAWYWILNMIPRHELRLGGCTPKEEADAAAKYTTILSEANGGIWLTKSTTKAAWAL